MDSYYTLALFLHVAGALGLVAALGILSVFEVAAVRATTVEALRHAAQAADRCGKVVGRLGPVVVLSAVYMVLARWRFAEAWVLGSLLVFTVMAPAGNVLVGRIVAIATQAEREQAISPALRERLNAPALRWHPWIRAAALGWVAFAMTAKPNFPTALVAAALALTLGVAVGSTRAQPGAPVRA